MPRPAVDTTKRPAPPRPKRLAPLPAPDPVELYALGLGESSRRTMRAALARFARLCGDGKRPPKGFAWHLVTPEQLVMGRARLVAEAAPATARRALAAVRGVLRAARRLGLLSGEAFAAAIDLAPVRGDRGQAGRHLEQDELARAFASLDAATPAGARDAAVLALLYYGGLRRAEVVALDVADYDGAAGALRVEGKGSKVRRVYLGPEPRAALEAWLGHRGRAAGPVFLALDQVGATRPRRLSADRVYATTRKLAKALGLRRFSPHDLRRTFVGTALDAGVDMATVQKMAGHASVQTTSRYDRRGERAKQEGFAKLPIPSLGRSAPLPRIRHLARRRQAGRNLGP